MVVTGGSRGIGAAVALKAAGAGGAEDVDLQLVVRDLDGVGALDERDDLDRGEGGLAPALVVERRDTHEPVRALFNRQLAVHVFAVDHEGRGLDAGLFSVGDVVDIDLVPALFRPAGVHAHEHFRPISGVDTAGTGADIHHCLALVVFAGQHRRHFQRRDLGFEVGQFVAGKRCVAFFFGELVHDRQVLKALTKPRHLAQPRLHVGQLRGHLLRMIRIVPQTRVGGLLLQLTRA